MLKRFSSLFCNGKNVIDRIFFHILTLLMLFVLNFNLFKWISLHCGWMKHAISFENPVGQQPSTIPLIELSFKKECNVEDKSMPLFLPNRIIVMHVMHFQFPSYWSFCTVGKVGELVLTTSLDFYKPLV